MPVRAPTTRLQYLLQTRGVQQYIIAAQAGFSPARLSEYCNGKKIPPRHLAMLAGVLRVSPEEIIGPRADPPPDPKKYTELPNEEDDES